MSVRKRTWNDAKDEERSAWVVDYKDQSGKRRLKTFKLKKEADAFALTAGIEVRDGTHVADRASITVSQACDNWLNSVAHAGREMSTQAQYRQHTDLHIKPFIGQSKLTKLTVPLVRNFQDQLREHGRSAEMVRRVTTSLGAVISDAQERGQAIRNPVIELGKKKTQQARKKGRLVVGADIPTIEEVRTILTEAQGRFRPFLITAVFTGLRASELRGLAWSAVDFDAGTIEVRQRADRYNQIGAPKSSAGHRTIPAPTIVMTALKHWKLECPKGENDLVFPNGEGNVENLGNLINRGLRPTMVRAGVAIEKTSPSGEKIAVPKYTGLHCLRHFYASWLINRKADGGLELGAKQVQERLGHGSIQMTFDRYGHLFPSPEASKELDEAAQRLFSVD
ncbi:MAG: site-specific integrase [Roseibium sp.]|uniref:tyrosine-type recombinase/integrase n=1 Tax=Roseibium sp. TaxID=1936156 RepID=UPI002628B043|nr:site-specific integrase [Roseibium sp.]MCV0426227.1 site-specific integrase [Roseibium sp.]